MQKYNLKCKKYNNGTAQLALYSTAVSYKTEYDYMRDEARNNYQVAENPFCDAYAQVVSEFDVKEMQRELSDSEKRKNAVAGGKRAKKKIADYARSNEWEWFCTFTFAVDKIDRYDYAKCSKAIRKWLNHIRERYAPKLKYIVVPEMHKDGAWHFHALLADCGTLPFVCAISSNTGKPITTGKNHTQVFNVEKWHYGFTTATRVCDTRRVSQYILKYITKTLCENTIGKQRYFCSQNLDLPTVYKMLVDTFGTTDEVEILFEILGLQNMTVSYVKDVSGDYMDVRYIEFVENEV